MSVYTAKGVRKLYNSENQNQGVFYELPNVGNKKPLKFRISSSTVGFIPTLAILKLGIKFVSEARRQNAIQLVARRQTINL